MSSFDPIGRRTFLKVTGAAAASSLLKTDSPARQPSRSLSSLPSLEDLAGDRLTHAFRDLYNPPAALNEWGYAQATKSVSGITAISFPPYACCGIPDTPWSPGFLSTCELLVDGELLATSDPPANQLSYRWYPHRTVREAQGKDLRFTVETFLPPRQRALAQKIAVKNMARERRRVTLGFDMRAGVTKKTDPWFTNSPGEADNNIHWLVDRNCLVFESRHSRAASVQGMLPKATRLEAGHRLVFETEIQPGETQVFYYFNVIAEDGATALESYDRLAANADGLARQNEDSFSSLVRAAFTPDNSEFSGHLPRLETDSEALWQLYHNGFKNLLFARRASPDSAYGTTYITLGGHVLPTLSFPWDTSMTSLSLALLDPAALRRLVQNWFEEPMHQHLATDCVTGQGIGPWYAVNDMAIVRCARDYLRVTGDFAWLDERVGNATVLDHLVAHALHWKELDTRGQGLADYGKIENLLEVVSTYLHEVAGMIAGNVSSMRFVAALLDHRGESVRANQLRAEASDLAKRINDLLYVSGKGWWRCGQPDGTWNEVRHCYDFLSVIDNMQEDLSAAQKREMASFFWNQLHTPHWMRALSNGDADVTWNIRPDHSCIGAYAAWPPMSAKALYKTDASSRVADWLRGLAKAGNQGPIGQAHFVETVFPLENGAAYKCPSDPPYMNDWCCISAGCFTDLVIDSIFGAELPLFGDVQVQSRLADFDSHARLANLRHQGKNYTVTENHAALA